MKQAIIIVVSLAGIAAADGSKSKYDETLRSELQRRVKEDQDARKVMIEWVKKQNTTDAEAAKKQAEQPVVHKVAEIDKANTEWLKSIVQQHGWPRASLVGADGAHNAWLLVQHADHDRVFQKKCLDLMRDLATLGEVAASDVAYLTDRVLVADGKKQRYGTQFHTLKGKLEPKPIEDEANVDKRRKAAGLPTMAEYRTMVEKMYQAKPEK
jgi:hypothetical protein